MEERAWISALYPKDNMVSIWKYTWNEWMNWLIDQLIKQLSNFADSNPFTEKCNTQRVGNFRFLPVLEQEMSHLHYPHADLHFPPPQFWVLCCANELCCVSVIFTLSFELNTLPLAYRAQTTELRKIVQKKIRIKLARVIFGYVVHGGFIINSGDSRLLSQQLFIQMSIWTV